MQEHSKSKLIAVFLSCLIPGSGLMYLGLLKRGAALMLGISVNIAVIPIVILSAVDSLKVPLVILFSILIAIQYLFGIFDSLQKTDSINLRNDTKQIEGDLDSWPVSPVVIGIAMIALGLLLMVNNFYPEMVHYAIEKTGGIIIGCLLIGGGGFVIFRMK